MDKLQTLENLAKALADKKVIKEQIQAIKDAEQMENDPEIQKILALRDRGNK